MRGTTILFGLGLLAVAFAGCAAPGGDDDDEDEGEELPTEDSYTVDLDAPPSAMEGDELVLNVTVEGDPEFTTDHVGAHFGMNSTDAPSTTNYPNACVHDAGEVPGEFETRCAFNEEGAVYIRGHLRVTLENGTQLNYWGAEQTVLVFPGFNLTLEERPTAAVVGQPASFDLTVEGPEGFTSDHVDAHFGVSSVPVEDASGMTYPTACDHQTVELPGTVEVTCTFTESGTYYVRGHVRLSLGAVQWHYWSEELTVTVGGAAY